jgi:hypothetical protein
MQVLKDLISQESHDASDPTQVLSNDTRVIHRRLLCIATAFELLSGQGVLISPVVDYDHSSTDGRRSPEYRSDRFHI